MKAAGALGIAMFVVGGACSGSGAGSGAPSGTLDCAWLAGDNCIKTNFLAAMSCGPTTSEFGVLSADNTTCSYASGVTITFDPPLQLPFPTDAPPPWHFTITRAGTECLRFDSADNQNFNLVVNGKAVTQTLPRPAATTLTVTCPDGASYSSSNPSAVLSCNQGFFSQGWGSSDTDVNLDLYIYGLDAPLRMFDCAR